MVVISRGLRLIRLVEVRFWHATDHWEGLKYDDVLACGAWVFVWSILLDIDHTIRAKALSVAVGVPARLSRLLIHDSCRVARGASPCCSVYFVEPAEACASEQLTVLIWGRVDSVGHRASGLHLFAVAQPELHLFAILSGFDHFLLLFWCFGQFPFSCVG